MQPPELTSLVSKHEGTSSDSSQQGAFSSQTNQMTSSSVTLATQYSSANYPSHNSSSTCVSNQRSVGDMGPPRTLVNHQSSTAFRAPYKHMTQQETGRQTTDYRVGVGQPRPT